MTLDEIKAQIPTWEKLGWPEKDESRLLVIGLLGGRCVSPDCRWLNQDGTLGCCDARYLQVDHVDNDGWIDRKAYNNTSRHQKYIREIVSGSTRYQLLCANCNYRKAMENTRYRDLNRGRGASRRRWLVPKCLD